MLALIEPETMTVWSLHATLAQLERAIGKFYLQKQFAHQSGESSPVEVIAVELLTTRHVGDGVMYDEIIILKEYSSRSKQWEKTSPFLQLIRVTNNAFNLAESKEK